MTRYLILAEGFSADPHYGKTMRGVLRYRRDDVVAILDSTRAGETDDGVPVVASVEDALPLGPDTALVGVATQGGRFPPAWIELLRSCIANGLDVENGLHVFLADDPELRELAAQHGVELRDLRRPPPDLSTATGANLEVPGTIVLTVGLRLRDREDDRRARARPRGAAARPRVDLRPDRARPASRSPAGASRSTRSSPTSSPARPSGSSSKGARRGGELLWVEGQGSIIHPVYSGVTLGLFHGSAPHLLLLCHEAGRTEIEGAGGGPHPIPPLRELVELHERHRAAGAGPRGSPRSRSTRGRSARRRRAPRSRPPRRRPGCPPTTPSGSAPGEILDAFIV